MAVSHAEATRERERYVHALDGVWNGLGTALARLERLAEDPVERLAGTSSSRLPVLQYSLHRAGELAAGLDPPEGREAEHEELAASLAAARDVTAEVCELFERDGPGGAAALVHEWRGALFRVRLARRRLLLAAPLPEVTLARSPRPTRAAAVSLALVLAGTAGFTAGAVTAMWPLWAAGLVLVAAGFLAYRP